MQSGHAVGVSCVHVGFVLEQLANSGLVALLSGVCELAIGKRLLCVSTRQHRAEDHC
jgi:hypothetical protein